MTIPSQPTTNISLGPTLSPTDRSIAYEFNDSSPHSISEFYRGGTRVANHPLNAGVPTSGTISFSQFNGATALYRYTISVNTNNIDLYTYATSPDRPAVPNAVQGWNDGVRYPTAANQRGVSVEFIINPGVVVGSATAAQNALTSNTNSFWNPAVPIVIINRGHIVGAGGKGSVVGTPLPQAAGGSGGTAIVAQRAITIQNTQGVVGGGGGGGGPGVPFTTPLPGGSFVTPGTPGGGGAGQVAGTGGQPLANLTQGGVAQTAQGQASPGGNGGPLGIAGQPSPQVGVFPQLIGGAAGFYAKGNANITWQGTPQGTRQGQVQPTV